MNKNQDRDEHDDEEDDKDEDRVHSATRDRKRGDKSIEALIASSYMCKHALTSVEV